MACWDDVRRIALSLPEAVQEETGFRFAVMDPEKGKTSFHTQAFAWGLYERIHPKKPRTPRLDVIALCVADEGEKEMLLAADPEKFFCEPHYNGYPVILVRLPAIDVEELVELTADAWRCKAPASLVRTFDQGRMQNTGAKE